MTQVPQILFLYKWLSPKVCEMEVKKYAYLINELVLK